MSKGGAHYVSSTREVEDLRPRGIPARTAVLGALAVAVLAAVIGFVVGTSGGDDDATAAAVDTTTSTPTDGDDAVVDDVPNDDGVDDGGLDDEASTPTVAADPTIAPPPTVSTEGLEGDALDLAVAINRAADAEYHAVYEGENTVEDETVTITVEVWRRLPTARRDTTISGTDALLTREFRLPNGLFGCIGSPPAVDFSCFTRPEIATVDPHAGLVIARAGEFDGAPVDCWEVAAIDTDPSVLCVDADGIPVVIDGGDGRLLRTTLDDQIDANTFTLPAPVED